MQWTTKSSPPHISFDFVENPVEGFSVGDVALADDQGVELAGERPNPALQRLALIGERDFRPSLPRRLGDAPGDRAIVGQAHHQTAFAAHRARLKIGSGRFRFCHRHHLSQHGVSGHLALAGAGGKPAGGESGKAPRRILVEETAKVRAQSAADLFRSNQNG